MYGICERCGHVLRLRKRKDKKRECPNCWSTNFRYLTDREYRDRESKEIAPEPKTKAHPWSQGRRMAYEKKKERQRLEKEREVQEEQHRLREVEEKTSRERRETERIKHIKTDLKKILVSEGITEMWENAKKHGMNDEEFINYLTGPSFQKSREEAEIILSLLKAK